MKMKKAGFAFLRGLLWVSFALFCALTVCVTALGLWAGVFLDTSVDEEVLAGLGADKTTRLYYYDEEGEERELSCDRLSGYENALFCPLSEVSPHLKNAFVAIEDKRFYEHGGIDWTRTGSAVLDYLKSREGRFGGSTITQQLVKNMTGDSEKSVRRKVAEMMRAVKLEKRLSKDEILEEYLNIVNLAENCYGVQAASNAYFSKQAAELDLREAATIAAITNNPIRYDPIRHPEQNRKRRDLILSEMLSQGMITRDEYEKAISGETELRVHKESLSGRVNSYYADLVVSDVIEALTEQKGISRAAAGRLVYCGGLKIYTAIDPEIQGIVEAHFANETNFPTHKDGKKAQGAMMVIDPKNGDILAVVGAIGEKSSNRVQNFASDARRPSGSVIKPLSVYAPALEKNLISYGTVFDDIPQSFRANGAPWPKNAPNIYRGLTPVHRALGESVNTVSVSVLRRLGAQSSFDFLKHSLGFASLDPQNDKGTASLALGQQHNGVTLREILGGYTALANRGVYEGTRSFYKVLDRENKLLLANYREERRVLSEETAHIMTLMLREVVKSGTAKSVGLKKLLDVAGKTGTSSNNCDKWFVGYTPELLAGVWYGHEYPESLADVGGNPALDAWDTVMTEIVSQKGSTRKEFASSENVVALRYCRDSGKLCTEACLHDPRGERWEVGYFKKGQEPQEYCDRHVLVPYCKGGGVATEDCPAEECGQVALLRVSRSFPCRVKVLDAPYTYGGSPHLFEPNFTEKTPYYAQIGETDRFYGIGEGVVPFNHSCPLHTADPFFWRRYGLAS